MSATTSIFGTKVFSNTKGEMNRISIWPRRPSACCVPIVDLCCKSEILRTVDNFNANTFRMGGNGGRALSFYANRSSGAYWVAINHPGK